jgi:hypothetical protein
MALVPITKSSSSGIISGLVSAGLLFGTATAIIYQMEVPHYRINMRKKLDKIIVDVENYTHIRPIDIQCETTNLECLRQKGYKLTQTEKVFGTGEFQNGNRSVEEFTAACKECNVKTHISVMYTRPLIGGYTTRKQTLNWSRCSVTELT